MACRYDPDVLDAQLEQFERFVPQDKENEENFGAVAPDQTQNPPF